LFASTVYYPVYHRLQAPVTLCFFVVLLPGALGLWMVGRSLEEMLTPLARRPDGIALRRYGEPQQVLDDVNAELAASTDTTRTGGRVPTFQILESDQGSSYSSKVWLTRSWIVCIAGRRTDRLAIFRLVDVVLAAKCQSPSEQLPHINLFDHTWVTLFDRHGVRLNMALPYADATRLLAEVLARVPWAVNHFDPAAPGGSDADLSRFIAEADRYREELRVTGQKSPDSSS
jgi:hypothetical protein